MKHMDTLIQTPIERPQKDLLADPLELRPPLWSLSRSRLPALRYCQKRKR